MSGPVDMMAVELAKISTKLDALAAADLDKEGRLRKVERAIWVAVGAGSAVGGVAGAIVGQVTAAIGG